MAQTLGRCWVLRGVGWAHRGAEGCELGQETSERGTYSPKKQICWRKQEKSLKMSQVRPARGRHLHSLGGGAKIGVRLRD